MARYHGGKAVVYLATTGSGTAVPMVSLSDWTLDKSTNKVDVTAFGDLNTVSVQGLPALKGTFSGWFDDTDTSMFDGAISSDGVKIYLYPSSLAPTIYHYGPAWLDASITCGVSAAVAIKGSFEAKGSWGRKP